LESTNQPYAIAKIAGIEMCAAFNRQHRTRFLAAMPTNLFGEGDNYDLQTSHVVPALIRKMWAAAQLGRKTVDVWGTGTARREFLYSDDLADACLFLMRMSDDCFDQLIGRERAPLINVGYGQDLTIRELAETIADVVGFRGNLVFDTTKPDGTPRKLLDCSRLMSFGWRPTIPLRLGLENVCKDFQRIHGYSPLLESAV
jgi:GDP-L-fucose synthase